MEVYSQPACQQSRHQGCGGLRLAHPGDVEGQHLVDSRQHSYGHVKALELQGGVPN